MENEFETMGIADLADKAYLDYATHLSTRGYQKGRSICAITDGLIPSYLHALQCAYELPNKSVKSIKIVGDMIGKMHFTGEASCPPVIDTLCRNVGILVGTGNHGAYTMKEGFLDGAAPRYSEAMLHPAIRAQLDKLVEFVPKQKTIADEWEWGYFPTPIPIDLVRGNKSIGCGIGGRIPAFTVESIYNAYIHDDPTLLRPNYGLSLSNRPYQIEDKHNFRDDNPSDENKQELIRLWETGKGSLRLTFKVKPASYNGDDGYEIYGVPELWNCTPTPLMRQWEYSGYVAITDRSAGGVPRWFIYRTKGTRAVTDEMLLNEIMTHMPISQKRGYVLNIFDGKQTGTISMRDWVKFTMMNYARLYKKYITKNLNGIEFDTILWSNFKAIANLYINQKKVGNKTMDYTVEEKVQIVNGLQKDPNLKVTAEHVLKVGTMAINTLNNSDPFKKLGSLYQKKLAFEAINIDNEIKLYIDTWSNIAKVALSN